MLKDRVHVTSIVSVLPQLCNFEHCVLKRRIKLLHYSVNIPLLFSTGREKCRQLNRMFNYLEGKWHYRLKLPWLCPCLQLYALWISSTEKTGRERNKEKFQKQGLADNLCWFCFPSFFLSTFGVLPTINYIHVIGKEGSEREGSFMSLHFLVRLKRKIRGANGHCIYINISNGV